MSDVDKLPGRRSFLRGIAGGVAGGVMAGGAAGYTLRGSPPDPALAADTASLDGRLPAVPFHGRYQVGIAPPPQAVSDAAAASTAMVRGRVFRMATVSIDPGSRRDAGRAA